MPLLTQARKFDGSSEAPATLPDPSDLRDLLAEKSLWQIYLKSSSVLRNQFNCIAIAVAAIALVGFAITNFMSAKPSLVDFRPLFSKWADSGIVYAATILGFLLAGFAVLFAVLRPDLAVRLRRVTRPGETLDELKLMFINFAGVFVYYTAFVFWCVVYLVAGGENGPMDMIGRYLSIISPSVPLAISHLAFVCWGMWFLVLVLKMKSFIYNLYQTLLLGLMDSMS